MPLSKDFVHKLPKAELHVHLDGSLRMPTIFELADQQGVKLPTNSEESMTKLICCDENTESLEDYLRGFGVTLSVMQEEQALERTAYELAEDAAKENIRLMEVRYSPILHQNKGLKLEAISEAVLAGLKRAEKDFKIKTGVIICGIRNMGPEASMVLAQLAVDFKKKGVIGYDLAGAEFDYPAIDHKEAFDLALKNNLNITVHAGEAYGPSSIHQAIHYCGTHRIGHGTRLIENEDLLNYVNDHRIPLEICLLSNMHTKAVQTLDKHPIREYLKRGLRVTLNTDNRLISNTTLTDEYMLANKVFGIEYPELKTIIINGFKSAFTPYLERVEIINQALIEMEDLEQKVLRGRIMLGETI